MPPTTNPSRTRTQVIPQAVAGLGSHRLTAVFAEVATVLTPKLPLFIGVVIDSPSCS
jgi:hypothetical protein